MPQNTPNLKIVMDLKSGVIFALELSQDNKRVEKVQQLTDGPLIPDPSKRGTPQQPKSVYGTTTFLVDETGNDDNTVNIYTLVWPSKTEFDTGKMPDVAINALPADLIKAGIAKFPDTLKEGEDLDEDIGAIEKSMENINKLVGLGAVKSKLKKQIALTRFSKLRQEVLGSDSKKPSLHMVYTGNPGTGKTTVAREYAKILHAMGLLKQDKLTEVQPTDMIAGYVGQTALKTREVIEKAKGGVLFIDEAYALSSSSGTSGANFGKEAIAELVAAMENMRDSLVVIVAGYPEPMKKFIETNEGLKSRFLNYIEFPDYDAREIGEILDFMTKDMQVELAPAARKVAVDLIEAERSKSQKHFGNGRTARNLLELAFENAALRVMEGRDTRELKKMSKADLKALVTKITLEDVETVLLDGISSKSTGKVGFDTDAIDREERNAQMSPKDNGDSLAARIDFSNNAPRQAPAKDTGDVVDIRAMLPQRPLDGLRKKM